MVARYALCSSVHPNFINISDGYMNFLQLNIKLAENYLYIDPRFLLNFDYR